MIIKVRSYPNRPFIISGVRPDPNEPLQSQEEMELDIDAIMGVFSRSLTGTQFRLLADKMYELAYSKDGTSTVLLGEHYEKAMRQKDVTTK